MSAPHVTVLDYGMSNLLNVVWAMEHCGAQVQVVEQAGDVHSLPDRLVLPGVGAFEHAARGVRQRGFDDLIRRFVATGRPFLGICVGAQLLLDVGEENGEHAGLGLIPGRVQPVSPVGFDGRPHRIPHIGWASLHLPDARETWDCTPLAGTKEGEAMYFVHSYAPVPTHDGHRLADTTYDGVRICAAVGRDNIFGCQFHPERSGEYGLGVLKNFLAL